MGFDLFDTLGGSVRLLDRRCDVTLININIICFTLRLSDAGQWLRPSQGHHHSDPPIRPVHKKFYHQPLTPQ
jgi:hypothetical protein